MHNGQLLSRMPCNYCSSGSRVEHLFHVEAVLCQALLRGITGMVRPHTYPPGIISTDTDLEYKINKFSFLHYHGPKYN